MYPNICDTILDDNNIITTMPQEDSQNLNDVLTTMATGAIPAESEDYTASEDIMDISSYAPSTTYTSTSTYQHAIPTSVITPTSMNNVGWFGANQNNIIHGGTFIPPSVTSPNSSYSGVVNNSRVNNGISVVNSMQRGMVGGTRVVTELDLLRITSGTSRRRIKDDELSPDERDKRRVRRERNKLAAAKCRQRRVDHTNVLVEETEGWEEKNADLEGEISKLQQQKEQLEFILEAHKAMCGKIGKGNHKDHQQPSCIATNPAPTISAGLETPVTEAVTPTSMFNGMNNYEILVSGETMDVANDNTTGADGTIARSEVMNGVTIKREPGTDPKRTLLQL